jgi:ATP-dependent DNA helicase RecG
LNASDILSAVNAGEDKDWEFKAARGGLPGSVWETYSAMANTDGGVIVLGIAQKDGRFAVEGVPDAPKMKQDFWNLANNRGKISTNLLSNDDVTIETLDGRPVISIRIPRASRRQRPVYVGQNPIDGTYRRYQEGDYKCSPDEVGRMLADQSEEPVDSLILDHFGLSDLDPESLRQYRNRFSARAPAHPWLALDERGLLEKLGGWRTDRLTGQQGLTVAGLLMFGKDEAIRDTSAIPQYHVDYRERLSDDPEVRWTDRLTVDGTWTANLFQFYQRVITRLLADLKVPFQLQPDMFRKDETLVHEAIREALVNALIHADYRGMGGIVIDKYRDRITLSNPGSLLLPIEQLFQGGFSECRNKSLQLMFQQIGGGEKAGSGIDKIRQGWASQKWRLPLIRETTRPDRVRVVLPMVSLLPPASLDKLHRVLGSDFGGLGPDEVQALVTADVEGEVTNFRFRQFSDRHASEITKLLQTLVSKGLLEKDGYGRAATYRLAGPLLAPITPDIGGAGSGQSRRDSGYKPEGSGHKGEEAPDTDPERDPALMAIAEPARRSPRLKPEAMRPIILRLCEDRYLTFRQLAALLDREPGGLQRWTLRPMAQAGQLQLKYPEAPNHPRQAYRTNPKCLTWNEL